MAGRTNIIYVIVGGLMTAGATGLVVKEKIDGRKPDGAVSVFGRGPVEPTPPAATDQTVSGL